MKILMSAFSCGPDVGSEPGIGWNWALEAARQGHTVHVLTQTEYKREIETEIAAKRLPDGLTFEFFMPPWLARLRDGGCRAGLEAITWQLVSPLWQIALLGHVRRRGLDRGFDFVHHITFGGIRHPTLLGRLDTPLVLGPLGGGERAPMPLRTSMPWRGWIKDLVRDLHTATLRFDPITRNACRRAAAIYAKTSASRDALLSVAASEVYVRREIGIWSVAKGLRPARPAGTALRLLFAGQHVYWKGGHLALRAVAAARRSGHDIRLTMVGSGPEADRWRRLASDLGLDEAVEWRGQIPFQAMKAAYEEHDAFLYPSLHDSSGNVVLEALARGLPVICLDLGGPGDIVTGECGVVVGTGGRGEEDCVSALARAIGALASSASLVHRLSGGALERARQFLWPLVVSGLYEDVARRLSRMPAVSSETSASREAVALDMAR
ncbi:MAG: glycosyltransferase family 4 protein [Hyphomicrobium sp.]|nr:glycosyltransferase family 4 protein [Hyphomicrobium sp.]